MSERLKEHFREYWVLYAGLGLFAGLLVVFSMLANDHEEEACRKKGLQLYCRQDVVTAPVVVIVGGTTSVQMQQQVVQHCVCSDERSKP